MGKINFTVAVIGAGAMGGAIASGLVTSGAADASHVMACNPSPQKLVPLDEKGVATFAEASQMLEQDPDVVVVAVKPQVLPAVVGEVAEQLAGRTVISIAAGVSLQTLEGLLPKSRVVRAMPNLPVQVLSGATAVCPGTTASEEDVSRAVELFSALGVAKVMREDQLDAEGAVVGCGPAYVALFADALVRAGVERGLPAADCREMVLATMRGVCAQLLESREHPRAYMEKVTSPGGTTAAGLRAMEPELVQSAYAATDAALARTRELANA
ncbi:MAG: pyrroline-5-carboxylate reductase [Coriobacteriaceae bacterium]|jgi:pyrroline-5-carboxylate reductase|nr:pyrroline-5-carboxylate reductase [Olsenella sp.]MCI1289735.1 pyrroline-5-carboxylate reductase [Olsenella sp.]RRF91280.1 MAG: pyrroline-5-carboxylate reductase [Coriobacteriaceae bacterium]